MTEKENYERSYKSMWDEIRRARRERDVLESQAAAGRDLAIALRHDMGTGTKVSESVMDALRRLCVEGTI